MEQDSEPAFPKPNAQEIQSMLQRTAGGSEVEQLEALEGLYRYANESNGDPDAWNTYGIGLHQARKFDQAIQVFNMLVEAFPEADVYRVSLATTYSQTSQFDLCKYHLRYIVNNGRSEEARRFASEQLEAMERFLKQTAADQELQQLQLKGLREIINSGAATEDDFLRLVRLILVVERTDPEGGYLEELARVLALGRTQFPNSQSILEYQVLCYSRNDPGGKMEETVRLLEQLAPNSKILSILKDIESPEAAEFSGQLHARAAELMSMCQSDQPELVESALKELQRLANFYQTSTYYRQMYAFGLLIAGRKDEARKQAEILEGYGVTTHSEHFHLGQVLWGCGDKVRGKFHLEEAYKTAQTDEERQDTLSVLRELESRA